jgi:hypothetical protein
MASLNMDEVQRDVEHLVARIDDLAGEEVVRWQGLVDAITELEARIAAHVLRDSRWADLKRHLRFRESKDWWDIVRADWPSVRRLLARPPTMET